MLLGKFRELSYSIGETVILDRLTADLPVGATIAIVGANGAGKSTFLSLLAGELTPTSGSIDWIGKRPNITYFKQEQAVEGDANLSSKDTLLFRSKWKVPKHVDYSYASGGERMKMRLSAALSYSSQVVLLDEPTNHLDQESLDELIRVLNEGKATYLIVSHDRHFIDRTADFVFEIEHGKLTVYEGNYTAYRQKKEFDRDIQLHQYEQQQRKIAKVEAQIDELSQWSAKAHNESRKKGEGQLGGKEYFRMKAKKKDVQIRSKRTRLEAELEKSRIEKPEEEITVSFSLKENRKKGNRVLELKQLKKTYGKKEIFHNVSFTVQTGERIALIGPNGSGKSTLFKMMMGEESFDGYLWLSEGMKVGYMSQAALDLPEDVTLAEYFRTNTYEEQGLIRIQLTNLGFTEAHWHLPIGELSHGERVKVKLMQFIAEETDVLLLDEPTNHLDLPSREQLEKTLATFEGTILFASHDRYFAERLADQLLLFENNTVRKLPLTYREWVERKSAPQRQEQRVEERLRLETELQAVLGKLSLLKPGDPSYAKLDAQFHELNKKIKELT